MKTSCRPWSPANLTSCDLPIVIRESKFYRNLTKRISSGEAPRQTYLEIEEFLNDSARSLGEQLDTFS